MINKNKLKDFVLLVKVELVICLVVPIFAAVLLNTSATQSKDAIYFVVVGLFCLFTYGIVKMFFALNQSHLRISEENENENTTKSIKYEIFIFIVAVIMPVAGLLLNNGFFGGDRGGIFGDFGSIWFYIIAILNGLIMLVEIKGNKLGIALFYSKIVGFTYITYFAIIFLPYLPYGFIGLILYGLGILVFVPITVFVAELFQILHNVRVLKTKFKYGLVFATVLGVVTIPAVLAVNFYVDKTNFSNALTYLSADSAEMPVVSIPRLERTLVHIRNDLENMQNSRNIIDLGTNTPIITRMYQVVALEDKLISLDTTRKLSLIFLGKDDEQPIYSDAEQFQNVNLIKADANTIFDEDTGVYKTWVDLEIRNDNDWSLAEYRTEFLLPAGCFIKDYYLLVGNERKQGILADKRAALITYNNIIRTPKDPGIIYYISDNVIELRVYPFDVNQVRKTGFLVWHAQSEVLTIDGREVSLTAENSSVEPIDMPGLSFVPGAFKSNLTGRERVPRYYFVIDASEGSLYNEHLKKVQDFVKYSKITNEAVFAASYKVWDVNNSVGETEGGFNLPLAMEMIFKEAEKSDLYDYPIIIAVSDNINKAPLFQKSNLAKQFPESEYYYNLGYDLSLTPYSFLDNKRHDIVKSPIISKTLDYNGFMVADNERSEVVINGDIGSYSDNEYVNAFLLQGKSALYISDNSSQIELVRDSFRQRVLTKHTAFTVLETRQQENALLELQAKFLNEDFEDAPAVMMDEPGLLVCIILAIVLVMFGRMLGRRTNYHK